jgi:4-oxalocrotonate tautomerase
MPIVQVYLYSGKSKEQKNELVKRISRDFEEVVGVKPESLHILFHDMERENWGFGGTLASEGAKK